MNWYLLEQMKKKKHIRSPFVKIGSQYWTSKNLDLTTTPQGNVIIEVQPASNVEKITNSADRDFSLDTGFWAKGVGVSISDGVCHFVSSAANIGINKTLLVINKWYKITFTISNYVSGSLRAVSGNFLYGTYSSNGTYNIYAMAGSTSFALWGVSTVNTLDIDNVSVQEVGWSESQSLYDYIYSITSGTVEQKTYAGVKAAAMWCNHNNDAVFGAIYGKLYNWYAVKLLQMDIDYYNATNPNLKFDWRVPLHVDYTSLVNNYGGFENGASLKLKIDGVIYWDSPNLGTNLSGMSILRARGRNYNGNFITSNVSQIWALNMRYTVNSNSTVMDYYGIEQPMYGFSVRLIKS